MCLCFVGAILPKVCKTKFSIASYDIFARAETGYETFSKFFIIKIL